MHANREVTSMTDTIRQKFGDSGLSLNQLSTRSGVSYASTHGFFASGRDAWITTIERWCHVLDLELVPKRKRKGK